MEYCPTSYADAQALADVQRRTGSRFKLAPNTTLERIDDERIGVRLYDTVIVTFYRSGGFSLATEGHVTMLTAERMNRYVPEGYRVTRKLGGMLLEGPDADRVLFRDRQRFGTGAQDAREFPAFREVL